METKYYLEYFIRHVFPYMDHISVCNVEKCTEINFSILHGIKFTDIWNNELKLNSKHAIWRYLHTLYLQTTNHPKINRILDKYKEHEQYEIIKKIFDDHEKILQNIVDCSSKFAEDILREQKDTKDNKKDFLNGMDEKKFENTFLNSNIGNLAKEISQEIDPSQLENLNDPSELFNSLLGGGTGGNNDLGKLFKTVGDKLQNKLSNGNINEDQLFNEAQSMMNMINPSLSNMTGMMGMGNLFSEMNNNNNKKK